jgi:hypothetical protein
MAILKTTTGVERERSLRCRIFFRSVDVVERPPIARLDQRRPRDCAFAVRLVGNFSLTSTIVGGCSLFRFDNVMRQPPM